MNAIDLALMKKMAGGGAAKVYLHHIAFDAQASSFSVPVIVDVYTTSNTALTHDGLFDLIPTLGYTRPITTPMYVAIGIAYQIAETDFKGYLFADNEEKTYAYEAANFTDTVTEV